MAFHLYKVLFSWCTFIRFLFLLRFCIFWNYAPFSFSPIQLRIVLQTMIPLIQIKSVSLEIQQQANKQTKIDAIKVIEYNREKHGARNAFRNCRIAINRTLWYWTNTECEIHEENHTVSHTHTAIKIARLKSIRWSISWFWWREWLWWWWGLLSMIVCVHCARQWMNTQNVIT